jgi:uncharacterized protein (TIGR03435 family)
MGCPLRILVAAAYAVNIYQIRVKQEPRSPGPRYDVIAKLPAGSTKHEVPLMLQELLAERFQLVVHTEKVNTSALVLLVGNRELALKAPAPSDERVFSEGRALRPILTAGGFYTLDGRDRSIKELTDALSLAVHRPVVDMTGLKGNYDFFLAWMASERLPQPAKRDLPDGVKAIPYSAEAAVQSQIGLKLESRKVPVEMLVIDASLKIPIEN